MRFLNGLGPPRRPPLAAGADVQAWGDYVGQRVDCEEELTGRSLDIVDCWATKGFQDWREKGKVTMTRVLLAKLLLHRDVHEVNRYLLAARPYAGSGSSHFLRPKADYDFAEIVLACILHAFRDRPDVLWPETAAHIGEVLLIERGYSVRWTVPGSLGAVRETENHVLMTEGARLLRNQWLVWSGKDKSKRHVKWTARHARILAGYLEQLEEKGLHEYNSQPYGGYTMTALVIIHAFAEEPRLVAASGRLLDRVSYQYAVSSLGLRRVVPFRRQPGRASRTSVCEDPITAAMYGWYGDFFLVGKASDWRNLHHALLPTVMPYRPGQLIDRLVANGGELAEEQGGRGLVRIGRGRQASPEIYWRGTGYVISAGGVCWGKWSHTVARPTVLLQEDGASDLSALLRIEGRGDWITWNNTGVHCDFAVGAGALRVPAGWQPAAQSGGWRVFPLAAASAGWVVAYGGPEVALFWIASESPETPDSLLQRVLAANPDAERLVREFAAPDGTRFGYDVDAPRGTWLMKSVDGVPVDRDYQSWPRLSLGEGRD